MLFLLYFYDVGCRLYDEHGANNSSTETTRRLQHIHQTNNDRDERGITSVGSEFNNRLFPLVEDAMRHLENGTEAMFDYLIHDGRKTIELKELSMLIPQAWSINIKYVYALNSNERNNVVYEADNLAYRLWELRFPTLVHVALLFTENNQHKTMGFGHIIVKFWKNIRNIGAAFRVVDDIEQYQHMVIERSGPACNMLLAPYNMDVPPFNYTNIDVEEWCHPFMNLLFQNKDTTGSRVGRY